VIDKVDKKAKQTGLKVGDEIEAVHGIHMTEKVDADHANALIKVVDKAELQQKQTEEAAMKMQSRKDNMFGARSGEFENTPELRADHVVVASQAGAREIARKGKESSRAFFLTEQQAREETERANRMVREVIAARNDQRGLNERKAKAALAAQTLVNHRNSVEVAELEQNAEEQAEALKVAQAADRRTFQLATIKAAREAQQAEADRMSQQRTSNRIVQQSADRVEAEQLLWEREEVVRMKAARIEELKASGEYIKHTDMLGCKCFDCQDDAEEEAALHKQSQERNLRTRMENEQWGNSQQRRRSLELVDTGEQNGTATETVDGDETGRNSALDIDIDDEGSFGFPEGAGDDSD
jgi:hypothetical protein